MPLVSELLTIDVSVERMEGRQSLITRSGILLFPVAIELTTCSISLHSANTKNCRNIDLYGKVLVKLNLRHDSTFPFNVDQIRNSFKKFNLECNKLALTVKTVTGIKRIQDVKGYGSWFDQHFSLIKSDKYDGGPYMQVSLLSNTLGYFHTFLTGSSIDPSAAHRHPQSSF